jgi:hypothetical protein
MTVSKLTEKLKELPQDLPAEVLSRDFVNIASIKSITNVFHDVDAHQRCMGRVLICI